MVEKYTHGHHQSVVKVHNARSVEDSAAFVLPLLEPHFKLLDVGCGPGSITQGFREYVKEVVGVDSSEDVIAQAKATCGQNVQFQVASVLVAVETRVVLATSLKGDVPKNIWYDESFRDWGGFHSSHSTHAICCMQTL